MRNSARVPSTVHPLLAPLAVVCFMVAIGADLAVAIGASPSLGTIAVAMMAAGTIGSLGAVAPSLESLFTAPRDALSHVRFVQVAVAATIVVLCFWGLEMREQAPLDAGGPLMASIAALLLLVGGSLQPLNAQALLAPPRMRCRLRRPQVVPNRVAAAAPRSFVSAREARRALSAS